MALFVSLQRPDLVQRQVLIGANYHYAGLDPDFDPGDDPDAEGVAVLKAMYEAVAVDPAHWPVFYAKSVELCARAAHAHGHRCCEGEMPTLVLAGDDEAVRLEHTAAMYEALPNAELGIVPGTSHALTLEKPDLVNRLILDFLAETEPPVTMLPIRRA